jgi:hypothetical protein
MRSKDSNSFRTTCQPIFWGLGRCGWRTEWYIGGQVVDIISSDNVVVNFMRKCHTDTFKWPSPPAFEIVHIQTVIYVGFGIEPKDSSLRFWLIDKINSKVICWLLSVILLVKHVIVCYISLINLWSYILKLC